MKTLSIFLALVIAGISQVYAQQSFCNVSMDKVHDRKLINFIVPKEVNVRQYRVEAGNDSTDFTVIGTVPATGNCVFVKSYHYEVFEPAYKYYRIGLEPMGAGISYSGVITSRQPETEHPEQKEHEKVRSCTMPNAVARH